MTDKSKINDEVKEEAKSAEAEVEEAAADEKTENAEGKAEEATAEKEEKGKEKENEKKEEPEEDENTKYMRLMADFQNYKKRVEKEKKDLYAYANQKIVSELLAVVDNFERALEQEPGEGFKEGMEMIFKQMNDVLGKSGLEEIKALGEDFDPNFHSAVMTEETADFESGKVSGVMQKGYTLNGKVIRPSMVKVAN